MDLEERQWEARRKQIWTRMEMEDRNPQKLTVGIKLIRNQLRKPKSPIPNSRSSTCFRSPPTPAIIVTEKQKATCPDSGDTQRHLPQEDVTWRALSFSAGAPSYNWGPMACPIHGILVKMEVGDAYYREIRQRIWTDSSWVCVGI